MAGKYEARIAKFGNNRIMKEAKLDIGLLEDHQAYQLFWGSKGSDIKKINSYYPELRIASLNQTHGDICVLRSAADSIEPTGDGHYTSTKGLALAIKTADCLPVMFFSPSSGWVGAAHAGWRGVANGICKNLIRNLLSHSASADDLFVHIGPHIQQKSFEINEDCMLQLRSAIEKDVFIQSDWCKPIGEKFYVNLAQIVVNQILSLGVKATNIRISEIDTKTDSRYCSFRRDKESAGRQISFVLIK